VRRRLKANYRPTLWLLSDCDGSNRPGQGRLDAPNPCHTLAHAIEFPIRETSQSKTLAIDITSTNMTQLFLDSNIFFQCRQIEQLPWSELIQDGSVTLLIPSAVLAELDRHKSNGNGRRASRARLAIGLLRKILDEPEGSLQLGESDVHMQFAPAFLNTTPVPPGLRHDHADDSILLEILACSSNCGSVRNVALLTDDTNLMVKAKRYGIRYLEIPEDWFLPSEPDDRDRMIKELQQRLSDIQQRDPSIELSVIDAPARGPIKVQLSSYPPLMPDQIESLLLRARELYPMRTSFELTPLQTLRSASKQIGGYHPPLKGEVAKYQETTYPDWLAKVERRLTGFHQFMSTQDCQFPLSFEVKNVGNVPAEFAEISISVSDGLLLVTDFDAGKYPVPMPPEPPAGKWIETFAVEAVDLLRPSSFQMPQMPALRDRNIFYWKKHDPGATEWLRECAEFRHKARSELLRVRLLADHTALPKGGQICCAVAASNMHEPSRISVAVAITYLPGDTFSAAMNWLERPPIH
jgi:PIN domain